MQQMIEYLKKGLDIVMLKGKTAVLVAEDKKALPPGLLFIAVAGVLSAVTAANVQVGPVSILANCLFAMLGYAIYAGLLHFAATRFFKGSGSYGGLFRAEALASVLSWALIVPIVGKVLGLWHLAVSVVIVENLYTLPRGKAVGAVAAAVVVLVILALIPAFFLASLISGPF